MPFTVSEYLTIGGIVFTGGSLVATLRVGMKNLVEKIGELKDTVGQKFVKVESDIAEVTKIVGEHGIRLAHVEKTLDKATDNPKTT